MNETEQNLQASTSFFAKDLETSSYFLLYFDWLLSFEGFHTKQLLTSVTRNSMEKLG